MKQIVCFHLFNDYSGSPKVLKMVLEGLLEKGCHVDLVTSRGGVLDELDSFPNLNKYTYSYSFSSNALRTMLRYMAVQLRTFFMAFRWAFQKDAVFYINTLLPAGPALAGRVTGKRVVYHYHENAFAKGRFYKILASMMQKLAHEIVCVSAYQASFLQRKTGIRVIPNALPKGLAEKMHPDADAAFNRKTVLMLASLKEYKGIREFLELAEKLPRYEFVLVVNDTEESIDNYMRVNNLDNLTRSKNLIIHSRRSDVVTFYNEASIVLTLTNPRLAIETFGLTALEAMCAGLPVIVPTVGGIAEMVENGANGFKIDVQDQKGIADAIEGMLEDKQLYAKLAAGATEKARHYDCEDMIIQLKNVIEG